MKLLNRCFLILYTASIISLIISCIEQSNQYIWGSISLMLILIIINEIISSYIKHKVTKQQNLPINLNYKILPIDISRIDRKKVGSLYSPITYIYINLNRKTITFPESKYGTERKYILMKINNTHAGTILNLKYEKKEIKITIHQMSKRQIKLLEEIIYNPHNHSLHKYNYNKMKSTRRHSDDELFRKIFKDLN